MVEHDEEAIMTADHVIDIGPGAGVHGGEIVAEGTPKQIIKNPNSLTGQYLSRKKIHCHPKESSSAMTPKRNLVLSGRDWK